MTFNLPSIMTMIKARQHKYTHRKMIGRDPKTNRIRYRYYYAEHHGGGITSAEIEAGSAFKLTYKGRRGHFHVQRTEGDKVFVKHDGRPNAKEVEMTKSELRALLKAQHETIETKKREKAQEARRKGRKKPAKKKTQTTAPKKTMRSYIAEQDEKISNLRAQIERLEQEEKNNPRLDHFDEIYKIKEEIGTLGRVRSIAQEADSLNNPKSSLNALKDPRDRTKGIIPLEAYNEIIGILEDTVKTQAQTPREQLTETAQQGADNFETMPERDTASPKNVMEARYTSAEETVNYLENRPREVFQRIKEASAEDVPYLYYEARKKYVKENRTEAVDDMIRELASRMAGYGDGFLIKIINKDVETGLEGRYTAKKGGAFDGELTPDKRKDLIARASHLFETSNASDVDTRARSYADTDLDQELSDVYTHLVSDRSLSNSDIETFKFKKNPPNRSATRSTMLQEIRASRGEPTPTGRTRYQQQNTSPAQANIEQANDLDKPTARGTRPKNATKADKELIEKLKDTITNTTRRGDKYNEARRLTVELQLAQSLKRYKDGHPTKGETATKENIYQIRRELRDRLKELTTGM